MLLKLQKNVNATEKSCSYRKMLLKLQKNVVAIGKC